MEAKNIKFESKYIITFDIECLTGLHIGGMDTAGGIGELDNPVIKDSMTGLPMISGSSLKGRIRERLEWNHNDSFHHKTAIERQIKYDDEKKKFNINQVKQCNCGNCDICHYFGHSNHEEDDPLKVFLGPTRILVRDAIPQNGQAIKWEEKLGTKTYTEVKVENTISRLTAIANPRQMERVPAGSIFSGEIVIDIYKIEYSEREKIQREQDDIKKALMLMFKGMMLIEDSFLGGGGSRGSGVVRFNSFQIKKYSSSFYANPEEKEIVYDLEDKKTAKEIFKLKAYETVA